MPCRSERTDCLVGVSRGRDRPHGLGTSPRSIERSIRLCPRPCVRLLPQTAQLGQPSPAPTSTGRSAWPRWCKSVQRSVAAAVSALPAPSVHALTRACGLAGCPRLGTRWAFCRMGPPRSFEHRHLSSNRHLRPTAQHSAATETRDKVLHLAASSVTQHPNAGVM